MAGFWSGFGKGFSEGLDREEKRRQFEETLKQRRLQAILPDLLERQREIRKLRQQKEAVYRKGRNLFGEKVANTLENMGELASVVSQYESTEGGKDWANVVTTRTQRFLSGMLESEDEEQRATALRLLERGSFYADASEAEQSDFLSEIAATGTINEEDLLSMNLDAPSGTSYAGQIPDLGKPDVMTPVQINSEATKIIGRIIPGAELVPGKEPGTFDIVPPNNVSPELVQAAVYEVAKDISRAQYDLGPIEAQATVFQDWGNSWDSKQQTIAEKYGMVAEPAKPIGVDTTDTGVDTEGAGIDPSTADSIQVQEAIGDIAEPKETPPLGPGWQPGVLDDE